MSKIVTRFPPEPSGYLHAGHLKSIWYNYIASRKKGGEFILRMDDANPETCSQGYVNKIMSDLSMLDVTFSRISYMSDYFDRCEKYIEVLLESGDAYVDTNTSDRIRELRSMGKTTECAEGSVETNMFLWSKMKKQSYPCKYVVRLRINDKNLFHPVVYKVYTDGTHYRSEYGERFVYPLFDFISPIADAIDGVTLIIRTTEFKKKESIHKWILGRLGLKIPKYKYFCRYNMEGTILSKRKLRSLICDGVISDWSSPIMPTLDGLTRRGFLMKTFKQYFTKRISYRENHSVENIDDLLKLNRKLVDKQCHKLFACGLSGVVVPIKGWTGGDEGEIPINQKNKELGVRKISYPRSVMIDKKDYDLLENGHMVFLINFGPFIFLDGEFFFNDGDPNIKDNKWIISWLNADSYVQVKVDEYGDLLTKKCLGKDDKLMDYVDKGYLKTYQLYVENCIYKMSGLIQLIRFGYYIIDDRDGFKLIHIREPNNSKQFLLKNTF